MGFCSWKRFAWKITSYCVKKEKEEKNTTILFPVPKKSSSMTSTAATENTNGSPAVPAPPKATPK